VPKRSYDHHISVLKEILKLYWSGRTSSKLTSSRKNTISDYQYSQTSSQRTELREWSLECKSRGDGPTIPVETSLHLPRQAVRHIKNKTSGDRAYSFQVHQLVYSMMGQWNVISDRTGIMDELAAGIWNRFWESLGVDRASSGQCFRANVQSSCQITIVGTHLNSR
jgi:hypothetical protein